MNMKMSDDLINSLFQYNDFFSYAMTNGHHTLHFLSSLALQRMNNNYCRVVSICLCTNYCVHDHCLPRTKLTSDIKILHIRMMISGISDNIVINLWMLIPFNEN